MANIRRRTSYLFSIGLVLCALALTACSTHFDTSVREGVEGRTIYRLKQDEAFALAYHAIATVLPGRRISRINGPVKGYSTYFRFLLDTYTQQVLVIAARGTDKHGNSIDGFYFEISGSGSSIIQGRAKNIGLYEIIQKRLDRLDVGIAVSGIENRPYKTPVFSARANLPGGSAAQPDRIPPVPRGIDAGLVSDGQKPALDKTGSGSGFRVGRNGFILTNHHVIDTCREIRIPPDSAVELVAEDRHNDLALLRATAATAKVATFREGRGIRPGETVVVAGYPLQGLLTSDLNITTGTVSALAGIRDDRRYLQMTAPVQQGSSGGPLLDLSGNVVGIVVAKLDAIKVARVTRDIPQNVNFAINAWVVRPFLDSHDVPYETARSTQTQSAADVAAKAKGFTVRVECWN